MKKYFFLVIILGIIISSCTSEKKEVEEGMITFSIDYPESKDNFFLYHVLPKELKVSFDKSRMEMKIKKANMENTLVIDNKQQKITAYYNYGEIFTSYLQPNDIVKVINKQPSYKVTLTNKKDTLLGFDIENAIAVNPAFPDKKIELWFTRDIKVKNPNWFNGFEKIPGVLLKYSIVQYGIHMEFRAVKYEDVNVSDSILSLKRPGKTISHTEYDKRINDLFESFK